MSFQDFDLSETWNPNHGITTETRQLRLKTEAKLALLLPFHVLPFASTPFLQLHSHSRMHCGDLLNPRPSRSHSEWRFLDSGIFSSVDLRPPLEDEIHLWARLLSWDYSGSSEMILRYVDAKILPGYVAVERCGRIFGYAFFVYEGSKGVIGDLFRRY